MNHGHNMLLSFLIFSVHCWINLDLVWGAFPIFAISMKEFENTFLQPLKIFYNLNPIYPDCLGENTETIAEQICE